MNRTRRALVTLMALGAIVSERATAADPEYIYGAELMTPQERQRYRRDLRDAPSPEAQSKVRERHRAQIRERARKRGVELVEPGGTVGAKRQ
jgi:hypothetical protein